MFQLVGVDRENLCDLWPDAPFLNVKKSSVDIGKEKDSNVSDVGANDVGSDLPEKDLVGRSTESERLLDTLRRKKILKVSRQNKLLAIQIEIAEIELSERRAHASDFERHFLRHVRRSP